MKILVIDDDFEILNAISSMLKKEGFMVDIALNFSEGRRLYQSENYDLVISDIIFQQQAFNIINVMDDKTGRGKIPLILISGMDKETYEISGFNIDTNLSKPFTNKQLLAEVNMILNPKKP